MYLGTTQIQCHRIKVPKELTISMCIRTSFRYWFKSMNSSPSPIPCDFISLSLDTSKDDFIFRLLYLMQNLLKNIYAPHKINTGRITLTFCLYCMLSVSALTFLLVGFVRRKSLVRLMVFCFFFLFLSHSL